MCVVSSLEYNNNNNKNNKSIIVQMSESEGTVV